MPRFKRRKFGVTLAAIPIAQAGMMAAMITLSGSPYGQSQSK